MIISTVNKGYNSVSLKIGEINMDGKYVKYDVVIAADGKYKRLSFISFPQAVGIYNDMVAQYIAE
jgi:hypothetical protein